MPPSTLVRSTCSLGELTSRMVFGDFSFTWCVYLPNPSVMGRVWHSQFSSGVKLVGIQCSFSLTRCLTNYKKKSSLTHYLLIAREKRIDGFIPFSKTLARRETQTASSRIWTLVEDSISYNDNRYATCAFTMCHQCLNVIYEIESSSWRSDLLPQTSGLSNRLNAIRKE